MAPTGLSSDTTTLTPSFYTYSVERTHGQYDVYVRRNQTTYESAHYTDSTSIVTFWSEHRKYNTFYTLSLVYPSKQIEQNVKKLLKRMVDALCKEGWIDHKFFYFEPQLIPAELRGVRLDGRGWANRK